MTDRDTAWKTERDTDWKTEIQTGRQKYRLGDRNTAKRQKYSILRQTEFTRYKCEYDITETETETETETVPPPFTGNTRVPR